MATMTAKVTEVTVEGLDADDVHVHTTPRFGVGLTLGTVDGAVSMWMPDMQALHQLWVEVGRKISHAYVEVRIDEARDDT